MAESPGEWASGALLDGDPGDPCLWMGGPVTRGELASLVDARQRLLESAGLRPGGTAAIRLPPSLEYVAVLLAAWRIGAQVSLLDHRLVRREVDNALDRLAPQVVVTADSVATAPMTGYAQAVARAQARPGGAGGHAARPDPAQLGIHRAVEGHRADRGRPAGRTGRYAQLEEYPRRGERIVVLASMVHVLGLVGGLLHGLHAGAELVLPDRLTAMSIRAAVAAGTEPTTVLGVPFHAELLTTGGGPLPPLRRMVVAGELVRPWLPARFTATYGVPLGTMYGMTELGVIATDLSGRNAPAVAPAPGMSLRVADGELLVRMPASPYVGLIDDTRWADGWLHTRDAASIDQATGLVTILGRLDSQISIGGLKVDLTEVEQTLCALPGWTRPSSPTTARSRPTWCCARTGRSPASRQRSRSSSRRSSGRRLRVLSAMPRTATGKVSRDHAVLRTAAEAQPRARRDIATTPSAPAAVRR